MRYILVVHQKNKQPDLREEFTDEAALSAELQKLRDDLSALLPPTLLSTSSTKVMFKYADFAGLEVEKIEPPIAFTVSPRRRAI